MAIRALQEQLVHKDLKEIQVVLLDRRDQQVQLAHQDLQEIKVPQVLLDYKVLPDYLAARAEKVPQVLLDYKELQVLLGQDLLALQDREVL